MIERGSKIAAQQQEQVMGQLVSNSISTSNQQVAENSDQNKVTRAVLQTTADVEKSQQAAPPPPPPPTEEERKAIEQQSRTQEEIIDQIVAQQTD